MTIWPGPAGYSVSDDTARIDVDVVHQWLSVLSYWAAGRPRQVTEKAIAHSLNLGLYDTSGAMAGFCRWVTDGATFAWLCDVFVDPTHRGHGLGVFLVQTANEHPEVRDLRRLLGTRDAHDLYGKFGFTPIALPERLMEIWPDRPRPDP
jgi:GNAT superfamily N-acetyltransferase